jgi:hypothetical protein
MKKILLFNLALMLITFVSAQEVWTGAANSNWSFDVNWQDGSAPSSFHIGNIIIPDVTNDPVMTGVVQTVAGNISIASNATLTLTTSSIQQGGTTDNNGIVILNSGSAFTTNADVSGSGSFRYNRNLSVTDDWYVISSPFSGQDIDAFAAAEPLGTGTGSNLGFGTYNTPSDDYTYLQSGASGTGNFVHGKGYIVRVSSTGDITFTGDNPSISDVTFNLIFSGNHYNLVGNPWPAFLKTGTGGLLVGNTSKLQSETIWVWNATNSNFETKVSADGFNLAPGQGFYVEAKSGGSGDLTFENSNLVANNSDTFRNFLENNFEVHLNLSDESINRLAKVYYISGTTTGFDNGYDGSLFGLQNNDLAIYTAHDSDENDSDMKLSVQSIPEMSHVVPVGINAFEGTEFTISATTQNRPDGYNVYLEDRDNNTFTLLNETSDFTTTVSSNLNGTGRFYLHTTTSLLNNNETNDVVLNVFKLDRNNFITVEGLSAQSNLTNLKLYNLLGKEVLSTTLTNNTNTQTISTEGLSAGIYVIKLESGNNLLTKKLIIK